LTVRICACDLDVKLSPDPISALVPDAPGTVEATCRLRIENASHRPLVRWTFLLYRLLQLEAATTDDEPRRMLPVHQATRMVAGVPGMAVNCVTVTLPRTLMPGESAGIRMAYQGRLVGYREAMPYVHDSVLRDFALLRPETLWYPVSGGPTLTTMRRTLAVPDCTLTVTAPEGWRVLVPQSTAQGALDRPRFQVEHDAHGLHLIAGRYRELATADARIHYLPGHRGWAREVLRASECAQTALRSWLGEPLSRRQGTLTVVEIPKGWGSQSLPGFILQAGAFGPDRLFAEVVHEVAHFWTPRCDPNRFCDEGMAHYLEALLAEERDPGRGFASSMAGHLEALRQHPDALGVPLTAAADRSDAEIVSRHKGAVALAVLDRLLGRTRLLEILDRFLHEVPEAQADAAAFAGFLEAEASWEAKQFVREWFRGPARLSPPASGPAEEALSRLCAPYAPAFEYRS